MTIGVSFVSVDPVLQPGPPAGDGEPLNVGLLVIRPSSNVIRSKGRGRIRGTRSPLEKEGDTVEWAA